MPVRPGVYDFEPGNAARRAAIWTRDAAGVQKQNAAPFFVSRNVSMTMQDHIDIIRRGIRRNMHEPKPQSAALKIDNERPVGVPIAVPPHHGERRTDRFEIKGDRRLANVPQVPDFIRLMRKIDNLVRQFVMRVREHKNLHSIRISHNEHNGHEVRYFEFRGNLCGLCARS